MKADNPNTLIIGKNGIVMFVTNYNDNETNIFDKTDINKYEGTTIVYHYNRNYTANCKLYKPNKGNMTLICKLNEKLYSDMVDVILYEFIINYKQYKVHILSNEYIMVLQVDYDLPFLYSDNQVININNERSTYTLNFNIEAYNDESLILNGSSYSNHLIIDKCQKKIIIY